MKNHQMQKITGIPGHLPVLDVAMAWLCHQRRNAPVHADVWHLRHHWERIAPVLQQQLQSGTYQLTPMQVVGLDRNAMWSAQDALVLKWVALQVTPLLPVHARCEHVKGHGGGQASIARLSAALQSGEYRYVCRTDIKGYYGAITKKTVMAQVRRYVADPVLLGLIDQYVHYTVEQGGEFYTPERGICRGCPLSPLIGAMHLYEVDAHFAREQETRGIVYARYMDDFIILAKSRWQLRGQVKALNGYLQAYGFIQHPDKTYIGRLDKGFDWMGAWLGVEGVEAIAPRALANHREKVRRLYERLRMWPRARAHARVSQYRSRWKIWATWLLVVVGGAPWAANASVTWTTPSGTDVTIEKCKSVYLFSVSVGDAVIPTRLGDPWLSHGPMGVKFSVGGWGGVSSAQAPVWSGADPTPAVGGQSHTVPAWVPAKTICGVTYHGLASADGHALLYAKAYGPWRVTNSTTTVLPNFNRMEYWSAAPDGLHGVDGSLAASYINVNDYTCFGPGRTASVMYWPLSLGGFGSMVDADGSAADHCVNGGGGGSAYQPGTVTLTSPIIDIIFIWDGTPGTGFHGMYDLPPSAFEAGDGYLSNTFSPSVRLHVPPVRPSCALSVDGNPGSTTSVSLGDISPSCTAAGCPVQTVSPPGAVTHVSVSCSASAVGDSATVYPVVDVSGEVSPERSNWLLKTSKGDAVTIWGTTVAGDNFGCGFRGWTNESYDPTHGGLPYANGKVWVPFPDSGSSFGAGSPWGGTNSGGEGWTTWQSKTATIQWGVCLDPTAGELTAGQFTASATLTLRVP